MDGQAGQAAGYAAHGGPAKSAIKAVERRKAGEADPSGPVVTFWAAPFADSETDAHRIFDALNWAKAQWPDMALATTGAKGAERMSSRRIVAISARPAATAWSGEAR